MRFTKLGHSCVRLEQDGGSLVIDPGVFTSPDAAASADAILITHEHPDHVAADLVRTAMTGNQAVSLWTTQALADQFADLGDRVHAVRHGDTFTAAGFDVHVYGSEHAQIHQDIPIIANVGFMVQGKVFHPGDALTVPEDAVETLLLPVSAPWLKASEMIDYGRHVGASRSFAIHDAVLNENGLGLYDRLAGLTGPEGSFRRLEPGTSLDL
jgi:L-ascorbate metabolism protein UlaG (beta-lactamase superfamily)